MRLRAFISATSGQDWETLNVTLSANDVTMAYPNRKLLRGQKVRTQRHETISACSSGLKTKVTDVVIWRSISAIRLAYSTKRKATKVHIICACCAHSTCHLDVKWSTMKGQRQAAIH